MSGPDFRSVVEGTLNNMMKSGELVEADVNRCLDDLDGIEPEYFIQGSFTVAMLFDHGSNRVMSLGISKRNPTDKNMPMRGKALSLSRAVREHALKVHNRDND